VIGPTLLLAVSAFTAPFYVRVPVAVLWVLVIPGLPWAMRMRLADVGDTAASCVGISVALTAMVGSAMALLGIWSPGGGVLILAALAAAPLIMRGPPRRIPNRPLVVLDLGRAQRAGGVRRS
jgi:hypothetical protein